MRTTCQKTGFAPPADRPPGRERRSVTVAVVMTLVLAVTTLIAATVASVGSARASAVSDVVGHEAGLFGAALALGLVFIVMGGITAWPHGPRRGRRG